MNDDLKRGFTLIEILVASMLLGMLMTILTMAFNSSAIAWRTGRAQNAKMSLARRQLSIAPYLADNAVPRVDTKQSSYTGRILGAWDKKGDVRARAVDIYTEGKFPFDLPDWDSQENVGASAPQPWEEVNIEDIDSVRGSSFLIGVRSWGPDGKRDTKDDICTLPFEVQ